MRAEYKEHSSFLKPNENTKIWRYMTFAEFVSLLEKQSLFFCKSDLLGDPFEGSRPMANVSATRRKLREEILKSFP